MSNSMDYESMFYMSSNFPLARLSVAKQTKK